VRTLVIDASIAVKWVIEEDGTDEALALRRIARLIAPMIELATRLAIEIDHPTYDLFYLALAIENRCQFVTADDRLLRRLAQSQSILRHRAIPLVALTAPSGA
jgi:predicted nucleic acid-binding protein